MWAGAGPGQSPSSPKQWKSDGRVKILQLCQREIATDEIQGKKN